MARTPIYERDPSAQQLGGTAKLSASVDAGMPFKALAGALGAGASVAQQMQGVRDIKTSNRYKQGYEEQKASLIQTAYGVSADENGNPKLNVPVGQRAEYIRSGLDAYRDGADLSGMSNSAIEDVFIWHDGETVAAHHTASMEDVKFEMDAAVASQQQSYNQSLIKYYDAKRSGDLGLADQYKADADNDFSILTSLVGEGKASKYKSDGYFNYVKTSISGALDEEEVNDIWSGLEKSNLDAGQHESLFNQKEAKLRAIQSGRTQAQRELTAAQNLYTRDIINEQQRGGYFDVSALPELVEKNVISERNAKQIAFEDWKINSGEPTKANDVSFSSTSSKIANGTISSFEALEEQLPNMTPDQYRIAEQQLIDRYDKDLLMPAPTRYIDMVQKSGATVLDLESAFDKIDDLDTTTDGKEALRIITSNAFKFNKNPSLSSAYKEAISEIYELERFLDVPSGSIGMTISGDAESEEDMIQWRDRLKSTYKKQVTDKTKKALADYSFKQPSVVSVVSPDGTKGTIPRAQLDSALSQGYVLDED